MRRTVCFGRLDDKEIGMDMGIGHRDRFFYGITGERTQRSGLMRRTSALLVLSLLGGLFAVGLAAIPASATFPGENGKIVWERTTPPFTGDPPDILSMDPDGNNQQEVLSTTTLSTNPSPDWSPDGTKIAFSMGTSEQGGLYLMNADGTNLQKVSNTLNGDHQPVFSPDGSQLAFSGNRDGGQNDVLLVDISSGDVSQLTTNTGSNIARDWFPDWSPDGSQIVFSRSLGIGAEQGLYLVSATGGSPVSITSGYDLSPSWSPDGTRIAFARDGGSDVNFTDDIYVVEPGQAPVNFTDNGSPLSENEPSWSPDGTKIAYAGQAVPDDPFEIFTKEFGTEGPPITEKLTTSTADDRDPDWGCGPAGDFENGACEAPPPPPGPTDPAEPGDSDGSSGALDETFGGGDGKVTTSFSPASAQDVKVYGDGSILAAGSTYDDETGSILVNANATVGAVALARYTPTGTLDTSFSGDGKRTDTFDGVAAADAAVIIPGSEGSFVIAGTLDGDFLAAKYTITGTLDPSFGDGGTQTVDFEGRFDVATGIGLAPDGGIVLGGWSGNLWNGITFTSTDFVAAKLTPTGTLDETFGNSGMFFTSVGEYNHVADLIITELGRIYLAGGSYSETEGWFDWSFVAITPTGTLDSTFGGDGKVTVDFGCDVNCNENVGGLALDENDNLVAAGMTELHSSQGIQNFALARLTSTGTLDSSFDGDGKVVRNLDQLDGANDVAIHSDGKIVAAGFLQFQGASDFGLLRLNSNGTTDTSFGSGGVVRTDFDGNNDRANGVAIDSAGAIIAVGETCNGECAFAIAKYADGENGGPGPEPEECGTYGAPGLGQLARDIVMYNNCQGYELDAYGGVHRLGGAPTATGSPYFPGFDIAREIALVYDNEGNPTGGFVLDGWGGLHPFMVAGGQTPAAPGAGKPYWAGFDIARDVWITDVGSTRSTGWMMDGRGAMHAFGGAPTIVGTPYFSFDIAREIVTDPFEVDPNGYILDGYGAMHPFGGRGLISGLPYFPGHDIANDALLQGEGGFMLDGFGGVHAFGVSDPPETTHPYTLGSDNYLAFDLPFGQGLVLSRSGAVFEWNTFGSVG